MTEEWLATREELAQQVLTLVSERPMRITTDAECDQATGWLATVRKRRRDIEAFFDKLIKPFRQAIKSHQDETKAMLSPLIEHETMVDNDVKNWRAIQRRKAEEAQRKADEQHQKRVEKAIERGRDPALVKPPPVIQQPAKTIETEEGKKVTFRQIPKFKIIDPAMVPQEFWKIDEVEIGKQVRAGRREIPGVHIWMEESSSVY